MSQNFTRTKAVLSQHLASFIMAHGYCSAMCIVAKQLCLIRTLVVLWYVLLLLAA